MLGERGDTSSTNDMSVFSEEQIMRASNDLRRDVQNKQALESMSAAGHLENSLYQELIAAANMEFSDVEVEEELMNMEAIQDAFNSELDEILSENAVSACMAKDEAVSIGRDEDDDDETRPGAQHIYPSHSQPSTAEEAQEDDASIVYDLFHRPASPYLAEVIPEAVPVDFDISLNCCVKVDSAAVVSLYIITHWISL